MSVWTRHVWSPPTVPPRLVQADSATVVEVAVAGPARVPGVAVEPVDDEHPDSITAARTPAANIIVFTCKCLFCSVCLPRAGGTRGQRGKLIPLALLPITTLGPWWILGWPVRRA